MKLIKGSKDSKVVTTVYDTLKALKTKICLVTAQKRRKCGSFPYSLGIQRHS